MRLVCTATGIDTESTNHGGVVRVPADATRPRSCNADRLRRRAYASNQDEVCSNSLLTRFAFLSKFQEAKLDLPEGPKNTRAVRPLQRLEARAAKHKREVLRRVWACRPWSQIGYVCPQEKGPQCARASDTKTNANRFDALPVLQDIGGPVYVGPVVVRGAASNDRTPRGPDTSHPGSLVAVHSSPDFPDLPDFVPRPMATGATQP